MRVLVTGVNGQLGSDVCKQLDKRSIEYLGVDIADFDLTNQEQTISAVETYHPDCVVHCAAYTAVDKAENDCKTCYAINVDGTRNIALACKRCNASMVYISTDYVFNGQGDQPFEIDSPKAPLNVYGESKLRGEQCVQELLDRYYIVRTSWVYGVNGNNFVKTMIGLGQKKEKITVVCDQIGSPTYTVDLAEWICNLIQTKKYGIYHATNEGYCSWYEFACEIIRLSKLSCEVVPVSTMEYNVIAKRPLNSRLSKQSLLSAEFTLLPSWQDAIARYINGELL